LTYILYIHLIIEWMVTLLDCGIGNNIMATTVSNFWYVD